EAISREALEVERRIAEANTERDRCEASIGEAQAAITQREAGLEAAHAALPQAETAAQKAAADVRASEGEMNAAEQEQGLHQARESHSLKLLSQLEARKNRLKQENMGLVFPEPEKLAGVESQRQAAGARIAELEAMQR